VAEAIPRHVFEEEVRNLMGYLQHKFGKQVGFAVFVFEFGTSKNLAYGSSAKREDMIEAIKEWLGRVEAGLDTDPPGPRAAT